MRLYIAVDFDKYTKNKILDLQSRLRSQSVKGRWKHYDNFHLTLKFLGEVYENKLQELNTALSAAAQVNKSFFVKLGSLGCFGEKDSIRVVWIGVEGQLDLLNNLYNSIENELANIGIIKEDRPYSPHITIGQDVVLNREFKFVAEQNKTLFETVKVEKFILMKSEQVGNRRVYTKVYDYLLRG